MSTNNKRIEFLDCSRALCMIWIVGFWHMQVYIHLDLTNQYTAYITNTVLATFTLISGYFLGKYKINSLNDVKNFAIRRLIRIYPLFFLACTSFLALHLFFNINYINGFYQYVLTLLGLSIIFVPAPQTIWFISMLILFYIYTPFLLIQKNKYKKMLFGLGIWLILVAIHFFTNIIDYRLLFLFPFYNLGLLICDSSYFFKKFNLKLILVLSAIIVLSIIFLEQSNLMINMFISLFGIIVIFEFSKLLSKFNIITDILTQVSYASMISYLFHRQYYGFIDLIIGNIGILSAYLFMLPSLMIISFYTQKVYDCMAKKILNNRGGIDEKAKTIS